MDLSLVQLGEQEALPVSFLGYQVGSPSAQPKKDFPLLREVFCAAARKQQAEMVAFESRSQQPMEAFPN